MSFMSLLATFLLMAWDRRAEAAARAVEDGIEPAPRSIRP